MLGPLMLSPFLPEGASEKQHDELCDDDVSANTTIPESDSDIGGFEAMWYPFFLLFLGHLLCVLGYVALIFTPWVMPGT